MCTAVAVLTKDLPKCLFEHHDLARRVHDRGGNVLEVRFSFADPDPLLPVLLDGRTQLVRWGSKDRKGVLPPTGWTWKESVDGGAWGGVGCETEPVHILACYGFEKGVWYKITEGVHGLLVRVPDAEPVAYMVCEPSTRYYRVMTRSDRMPWLIGEVI